MTLSALVIRRSGLACVVSCPAGCTSALGRSALRLPPVVRTGWVLGGLAALTSVRVVRAEGLLADAQGSPVQGPGLLVPAHGRQRPSCVAEVDGYVGMVRAEGCLINAKSPLVEGEGFTGAAQGRKRLAEVVVVGGQVGVVGAQRGLVYAQCALVQGQRLVARPRFVSARPT